jgi:hypothetical protein
LRYIQQQQSERRDIKMGPKELNNHAVKQFERGQLNVALEAFSQAFRVMPHNPSIALNLLQCLVDKSKKYGDSFNSLLAQKCFKLLKKSPLAEEQSERFDKLLQIAKEMKLEIS